MLIDDVLPFVLSRHPILTNSQLTAITSFIVGMYNRHLVKHGSNSIKPGIECCSRMRDIDATRFWQSLILRDSPRVFIRFCQQGGQKFAIFACKDRCEHFFSTCVKRSGDHYSLFYSLYQVSYQVIFLAMLTVTVFLSSMIFQRSQDDRNCIK